ncbi:MAG: arginine N-succinyltransferase [Puniceicoccaceae bacterium]
MGPEFLLRPVEESDLPQLESLVSNIADGMTTLPEHPEHLENRIHDSVRAFDPRIRKPAGEVYLFVLEDTGNGQLIGTSGIISRVGGFDPFYTYKVKSSLQEYEPLNIHNTLRTLELIRNHKGPSEICSLFLHPDYRQKGTGKLLSLARFLFMKAFPDRFDESVIAELRGFIDGEGKSPFWEAVGKNFFWKDYYEADVLSGIGEKDFIEALMPDHPIYVNLLPRSAREIIGTVHPQTEPAKAILIKEGFRESDEVDIFDAGPILQATRQDLQTWQNSGTATLAIGKKEIAGGQPMLLANHSLEFRSTVSCARLLEDKTLETSPETATALRLKPGEPVQFMTLQRA